MTVVPFPEFAPDSPNLTEFTTIAVNVIPITMTSYGPFPQGVRYTTSGLSETVVGMFSAQNIDDTVFNFAGTLTDLVLANPATLAWDSVGGISYSATVEDWHFAQFNTLILATDFADPIQSYQMGIDTAFSDLSADAPHAKFICVTKTFAMVANTFDPVGGNNPARLWWPATNDPTNWPTPGSATAQEFMSDYTDLIGPQGDITGLVPSLAGADVAIVFQRGIMRGSFVGPPDVFDFFSVEQERGSRMPNSIVPNGAIFYYRSDDGFYSCDGSTSTPIGAQKVDAWFAANINQQFPQNVIGSKDVTRKCIMWIAPSMNSPLGAPDMLVLYRWDIQRWAYALLNSQWIGPMLTFNITMDSMDSLGYTDVDTLPYSLDSPFWLGAVPETAICDPDGYLVFFAGSPMQAQIGTAEVQLTPGRKSYVQSVRPMVDGGVPTISVSGRDSYNQAAVFGPDVSPNVMGECPQRSLFRYQRARMTIPAGAAWTQALGVDPTFIDGGWR